MAVDAVVVAFRTGDVLQGCVNSLLMDELINRVYVVDNSPDFPLGLVKSERVTVLSPGRNVGFGSGVNYASEAVDTEFVAIVNPDLVVDRGTVAACVDYLAAHSDTALLSPRVYVDGQLFRTSERDASLIRYLSYPLGLGQWLGVERSLRDHRSTHRTDAVNGAFMLARRSALDEVGWFDSSIFLFGEEIDLCRRLRRFGWNIVYLAEGKVNHFDGFSAEKSAVSYIQGLRRTARIEQLRRARGGSSARVYEAILNLKR